MSKGLNTFSRLSRRNRSQKQSERESQSYSRRPQTWQTFEHSAATFLVYCFCCCFPFSILIGSVGGSRSPLTQADLVASSSGISDSRPPTLPGGLFTTHFSSANQIGNNEQYPVTAFAPNQPLQPAVVARLAAVNSTSTNVTTISTTAAGLPQQQPKSLKFTLIAGKFWKFIISKTSSFTSHKEGELRLHRIISANNYIIDDDNWFQYDPQQQQLFAWPSLATRPATYHFALLPSGVDIEADSENTVSLDVVANIIVELIRPLYQGSKNDIDQLIDYKFSLEDLHRHPSYPLLLQQIVSVFDTITTKSNNTLSSAAATTNNNNQQQLNSNNNNRFNYYSLSTLLKGSKLLSTRFSDYLLINYTYSPDGDFFSLTWSSQPTLANNTISLISECRLANIIDVVAKLSGSTAAKTATQQEQQGYYIGDERYVIYYPLDAPLVNSQAIVPKERGNNALRLSLNGPCQREKIIEELGIVGRLASNATDIEIAGEQLSVNGNSPDVDDKVAGNIVDLQPALTPTNIASAASKVASITITPPGLPSPEAIDSSITSAQITASTPWTSNTTTTLPTITVSAETSSTKLPPTLQQTTATIVTTPPAILSDSTTTAELQPTIIESPTEAASDVASVPTLTPATTTITIAATTQAKQEVKLERAVQVPPLAVQQSKSQPQAKSFANFLESTDNQPNFTMTTITVPKVLITNEFTTDSITTLTTVTNKTANESSAVPIKEISSESSLNEDFMGILSDVMDYLISVAVPVSIVIGIILLISIFIALCSLCIRKRKSKQFQVRNRFNFRYGSERRGFLKNSSKPVILDADRKSLSSLGATPQHRSSKNTPIREQSTGNNNRKDVTYLPMHQFSSKGQGDTTFTTNR